MLERPLLTLLSGRTRTIATQLNSTSVPPNYVRGELVRGRRDRWNESCLEALPCLPFGVITPTSEGHGRTVAQSPEKGDFNKGRWLLVAWLAAD